MLVRLLRIESMQLPEGTGRHLCFIQELPTLPIRQPFSEIEKIVGASVAVVIPKMQFQQQVIPKIMLFLTEEEYEQLETRFQVNLLYEVSFSCGTFSFKEVE